MCIRDSYERDKSKRAFRFVKLRDADFENKVSITDEAVAKSVSYTHLRAHETVLDLVCRLLLEKKKPKRDI